MKKFFKLKHQIWLIYESKFKIADVIWIDYKQYVISTFASLHKIFFRFSVHYSIDG
jgi:hypothetical protein